MNELSEQRKKSFEISFHQSYSIQNSGSDVLGTVLGSSSNQEN